MNGDHGERKETAGKETILMKEDSIEKVDEEAQERIILQIEVKEKTNGVLKVRKENQRTGHPRQMERWYVFLLSKDFMG